MALPLLLDEEARHFFEMRHHRRARRLRVLLRDRKKNRLMSVVRVTGVS